MDELDSCCNNANFPTVGLLKIFFFFFSFKLQREELLTQIQHRLSWVGNSIKQLGPNFMCGWQYEKKPSHWLKFLLLRWGGFRLASNSRKYHCGATSRGMASPHYLSRCPPSCKSNGPKQSGGGEWLVPRLGWWYGQQAQPKLGLVFTWSSTFQTLSSALHLSLSCQTHWGLASPPTGAQATRV